MTFFEYAHAREYKTIVKKKKKSMCTDKKKLEGRKRNKKTTFLQCIQILCLNPTHDFPVAKYFTTFQFNPALSLVYITFYFYFFCFFYVGKCNRCNRKFSMNSIIVALNTSNFLFDRLKSFSRNLEAAVI